ncbi:MAG TPA: TIGR03936 family radical SAM-associated protein [Acidimicrobiales bacterium]|nr:TIGR03936 family radical SAM-associated protein [Acidimicrobiales bacterium]
MRIRIKFSKTGKIRWTSHRDVARMWERAFRRTDLPLAYSVGFSPRPKVSFGLALSTGHESVAEYLDLELDPDRVDGLDIAVLPSRLSAALPDGIEVLDAHTIEDRHDSLQHEVTSTTFEVVAAGAALGQMQDLVAAALAADAIIITRTRKGRPAEDDVRPAILSVTVLDEVLVEGVDDRPCVRFTAELATQPRGLRPAELLTALSPELEEVRVRRTHQWISRADGARVEPLSELDPPDAFGEPPAPLQLEPVS